MDYPAKPVVTFGVPELLDASAQTRLERAWAKCADPMLRKALQNDPPIVPAQDPLLIATIREIRDGYFQLFAEQRVIREALGEHPFDPNLHVQEEDNYNDLTNHTRYAYKRLRFPGYGVSPQAQTEMFGTESRPTESGNPLPPKEAKELVGKIIRNSIDSFQKAHSSFFGFQSPQPPQVRGHISVLGNSERMGKTRSMPRAEWVNLFDGAPSNDALWKR